MSVLTHQNRAHANRPDQNRARQTRAEQGGVAPNQPGGPAAPTGLVATSATTVLRIGGAGLLAATAGIHASLWTDGYRSIPVIGPLFLLDAIAASILTLAVLGLRRRWLPLAAVAGALLELGTLGGLILSTQYRLFGFVESTRATLYWQSVIVEIAGAVVLAVLAALTYRWARGGASNPWW